ncbi:MAG: hypothetical protein K8U03_03420 [Planctomycetia bacterium]|nr:hypothetical protein [Planctomycetia bacterium]
MAIAAPPTAAEVVATFVQATEANRTTPVRLGNVLQLGASAGEDVLVSADLHGHRANFEAILALADLDRRPRRHLIMQEVCHGGPTYPGGGCMSHRMLEDVARLKVRYPDRFHFLLSNHELAELTEFPIMKSRKLLNVMFRLGMQEAYGADTEQVRTAALEFIASCPAAARVGQSVFVSHSCPEKSDTDCFDAGVFARPYTQRDFCDGGAIFRLVWGRDFRAANAVAFAKAVNAKCLVHGHEPCPLGYRIPNDKQIIIDCCNDQAAYCLLLPMDRELGHAEVVQRLKRLEV